MSMVEGKALLTNDDVEAYLPMELDRSWRTRSSTPSAALHSVDPDAVGLGDLGRPTDYVARQLRTWYGSWTSSAQGAQYDDQRIHDLHGYFQSEHSRAGPGWCTATTAPTTS
ncbi:MAG: hypothetical protein R2710_21920 [Acidimicrobiales bacterium]